MNRMNETQTLWRTLALLALAVVLVIVVDSLPYSSPAADGMTADDLPVLSTDTEETRQESEPPTDSATEPTAETEASPPADTVRLTFLGECAPGSPYGTTAYGSLNALTAAEGTAYFFSDLLGILDADHLTVAASACTFSDSASTLQSADCAAPSQSAAIFADGSVELIVNTVSDTAAADTQAALSAVGIDTAENESLYFFSQNGISITVYTTSVTKNSDAAHQVGMIQEARLTSDFVVVYFIGGEENSHVAESWLRDALHTFVDAGASLIVGAGNGVLRPYEYYGNALIAYSLGGIIDGSHLVPENAAVLLQVDLEHSGDNSIEPTYTWIPCYVYDEHWQPTPMTDPDAQNRVLHFLAGEIPMPIEVNPN